MDEFVYMGDLHLQEHARKVERVNRRAWMVEDFDPTNQPRRRFPRLRDR